MIAATDPRVETKIAISWREAWLRRDGVFTHCPFCELQVRMKTMRQHARKCRSVPKFLASLEAR